MLLGAIMAKHKTNNKRKNCMLNLKSFELKTNKIQQTNIVKLNTHSAFSLSLRLFSDKCEPHPAGLRPMDKKYNVMKMNGERRARNNLE